MVPQAESCASGEPQVMPDATALAAADAATPAQLAAAGVRSCAPMGPDAAERYAFYARGAVASLAMLDYPYDCEFVGVLPANPVHRACAELCAREEAYTPAYRLLRMALAHCPLAEADAAVVVGRDINFNI